MRGLISSVLVIVLVIGLCGVGEGWAQMLSPISAQTGDTSTLSVPAAPADGASSSRMGTWMRENVGLSAGVKIWLAKWQVPFVTNGTTGTSTSDYSPMVGPTITVSARLRDSVWLSSAFANFTWLQSGGFDLEPARLQTGGGTFDVTQDAKRRDYTLSAGVTVYKGLGIFAGYYNTQQRFAVAGNQVPGPGPVSDQANFRIRGPLVGVFGSSSLTERVGVYGNAAFGILNYQTGPSSGNFTASGTQAWSTELGLNIAGPEIWKFGTTFQVGFRTQVISINVPNPLTVPGDQHRNDITWGPTFAFMGTF